MGSSSTVALIFELAMRSDNARGEMKSFKVFTQAELNDLSKFFNSTFSSIESSAYRSFGGAGQTAKLFINSLLSVAPAAGKVSGETRKFEKTIADLAGTTGKTASEIVKFLGVYNRIEKDSQKLVAAVNEFGRGSIYALLPQLDSAATKLKELNVQTSSAGSLFAAAAGPVGVFLAATAGLAAGGISLATALYKVSESSAKVGDEVYKASQKTSLGAELISVFRRASIEADVSFDTTVRGLARTQNNFVAALVNTHGTAAAAFRAIGFEGDRLAEAVKNPNNAIRELVEIFNRLPPTAERDALAIRIFGRDAYTILPVLNQLKDGFADAEERARSLGQLFSDKAARDAHFLAVETRDLSLAWEGLKLSFATANFEEIAFQIFRLTEAIKSSREEIGETGPSVLQWTEIILDSARRLLDLIGGIAVAVGLLVQVAISPLTVALLVLNNLVVTIIGSVAGLFSDDAQARVMRFRDSVNSALIPLLEFDKTLSLTASLLSGTFSASPFAGSLEDELKFDEKRRKAEADAKRKAGADRLIENRAEADREEKKRQADALRDAQEQARAHLRELENVAKEEERIQQRRVDAAKHAFEQRRVSLADEYATEESAARAILDVQLKQFDEEKRVIEQTIAKAGERRTRLAEIADKEAAARETYGKKLLDDQADLQLKERQLLEDHAREIEQIAAERDGREIAAIKDFQDKRYITELDGEQRIVEIQRAAINRQQENLIEQLRLAGANVQEQARVNGELRRLSESRITFEEEALRRLQAARNTDLANLRQYRQQLQQARIETAEVEMAATRQQLENLKASTVQRQDLERLQTQIIIDAAERRFEVEREFKRKVQADREADLKSLRDDARARQDAASQLEAVRTNRKKQSEQLLDTALKPDSGTSPEELSRLRAEIADAQRGIDDARNEYNAAKDDYMKAQADLLAAQQQGQAKEAKALSDHTEQMKGLYAQLDTVEVRAGRSRLATQEEIISAEYELRRKEIEFRHARTLADLRLQKEELDTQLADQRKAVSEGKATEASLTVLLGKIQELNRRIKAEEGQQQSEQDQNDTEEKKAKERADPSSKRSRFGDVFADTMNQTGSLVQSASAMLKGSFEELSASAGNMQSMLVGAFGAIGQGFGSMVEALLTGTNFSIKALGKLLTATLAHLAAESAVKALYEWAASYASAAIGDLRGAALHAAAAKFYGVVALVAAGGALGSRALFGSDKSATSAGSALGVGASTSGGTSGQPQFDKEADTFTRGAGAQGTFTGNFYHDFRAQMEQQARDSARREAAMHATLQDVADALRPWQGARAGDILERGVDENPQAYGRGLARALQENPTEHGKPIAAAVGLR